MEAKWREERAGECEEHVFLGWEKLIAAFYLQKNDAVAWCVCTICTCGCSSPILGLCNVSSTDFPSVRLSEQLMNNNHNKMLLEDFSKT